MNPNYTQVIYSEQGNEAKNKVNVNSIDLKTISTCQSHVEKINGHLLCFYTLLLVVCKCILRSAHAHITANPLQDLSNLWPEASNNLNLEERVKCRLWALPLFSHSFTNQYVSNIYQ